MVRADRHERELVDLELAELVGLRAALDLNFGLILHVVGEGELVEASALDEPVDLRTLGGLEVELPLDAPAVLILGHLTGARDEEVGVVHAVPV